MERRCFIILLGAVMLISLLTRQTAMAQAIGSGSPVTISGTVSDGREPLMGANVFIVGTIDGCLTDSLGRFTFTTNQRGIAILRVTYMGFSDQNVTDSIGCMHGLRITMKLHESSIDEMVITASAFNISNGSQTRLNALDVVSTGNSCGDYVAALKSLPGSQHVGEDGKLYVRGGASEECQTFVNGMHVLNGYGTDVENQPVRGRFSPFLFKGINFSLGGYSGEYGQALSSVLPMETTDVQPTDKLGVSASLLDWNVGGTKAFSHSSLSFNAAYTDMGFFNSLFDERMSWTRPYRQLAMETQYKQEFSSSSVMKTYLGYDLSSVGQVLDDRHLSLVEHNIYANITHRLSPRRGMSVFYGAACSTVFTDIKSAVAAGDRYHNFRNEVHLKTEVSQVVSQRVKVSAGMEDYIRNSRLRLLPIDYHLDYNLLAAHADVRWRALSHIFLSASARAEQTSYDHRWLVMPRATLSYVPDDHWQLSLMAGRYSQTPTDDILAQGMKRLRQATADHAILSMQYSDDNSMLRIEPYAKRYHDLPLLASGLYTARGHGWSRGIDVYLENHSLIRNLSATITYSFCDARRIYLDYPAMQRPTFLSRHNAHLTVKYGIGKMSFGITESFASGRRFAQSTTPYYNSVDACVTWLASKKVIVYTSLSNLLGRKNIYKYDNAGHAVRPTRDHFLYIGIFISLKSNKAYDISNF